MRKKKGDPELLLVSFCDIVTITTAAMFMAMIIVIDEAARTPIYRPTPIAHSTTNSPVFFECRNNQLYFIDQTNLMAKISEAKTKIIKNALQSSSNQMDAMLTDLSQQDIGDEYYKVDPGFLLVGQVALTPRTNTTGITMESLTVGSNKYFQLMSRMNKRSQYMVMIVRDDSFPIFRKVRQMGVEAGFDSGWEYLGLDEPISFIGMFGRVKVQ